MHFTEYKGSTELSYKISNKNFTNIIIIKAVICPANLQADCHLRTIFIPADRRLAEVISVPHFFINFPSNNFLREVSDANFCFLF